MWIFIIQTELPVSDLFSTFVFWLLKTACFCSTWLIQSSIWASAALSSTAPLPAVLPDSVKFNFFASSSRSASDPGKVLKSMQAAISSGRSGLNKSPSDLWWCSLLFESDFSVNLDGFCRFRYCSRKRIVTSGSELKATIGRFGSPSPESQLHYEIIRLIKLSSH